MPVVMLIAIVAVLVGVFFAATGRGGEMSYEPADHTPLDLGPVSAADVALLRPPTAMWGYNVQVTDEALEHIARALRERDVKIARLQEQLAGPEPQALGTQPGSAHALADSGLASDALPASGSLPASADFGAAEDPTLPDSFWMPGPSPSAEDFPEPDIPPVPEDSRVPEAGPVSEAPAPPEAGPVSEAPAPPEVGPVSEAPASPEAGSVSGVTDPVLPQAAESQESPQSQQLPQTPQTPLVLIASAPPASSLDQESIQSSEAYEATRPSAVVPPGEPEAHDGTQPSEVLDDGPQGAYDTHGWWAEQKQAVRDEALRPAADREADQTGAQEQDR